jgi:pseudoazurin
MRSLFVFLVGLFISNAAMAGTTTVEMLNKHGKEKMVFSQKIVKIAVGDKIHWKATDRGHNVQFIKKGVPKGVGKYKSKVSKDAKYTFTIPGIYAYWCTPHKNMGMIGYVIVGGDTSNIAQIKKLKFRSKSKKVNENLIPQLK